MTAELVSLNGALLPREQARVSVDDYGFLYGFALFETMRAYRGKIFLLERHLDRLRAAAGRLGFGRDLEGIDLGGACRAVLQANSLKEARLRLTVSRGVVAAFPGTGVSALPTVLAVARRYTPLAEEVYRRGYRAVVAGRRFSGAALVRMKTSGYLLNLLAKGEAEAAGYDEALLLNEKGHITEGSVSNVFFVAGGRLLTPPLESGLLPGITRQVVLELAVGLGISTAQPEISPDELPRFTEAFLTNAVMTLMPLVAVRDGGREMNIGTGRPGEVTMRLLSAYRELVARETA